MGFLFTLLFLATAYVTPTLVFGQLGQYHVVLIFALLAILASAPRLAGSGLLKLPQTYAVLGMTTMVVLSTSRVWLSGIPGALEDFLPVAAAFFLTAVNLRKLWQFRLIVLAIFLGSAFFIARGAMDLQNDVFPSAYLYTQEAVARIRGLGMVNDPNDLAQVLVSLLPLVFLWHVRSRILTIVLLAVPIAILLAGMFLTHSRGSAIALMVVVIVAFRRKIGTVPAAVLGGLLLVGVLAAGWGAGRDVSMEAGADRLDAWATGISYIKYNPLLGIGYRQFAERNGLTAHNSVVVCAAEIGIPGFVCWVLFIFSSLRIGFRLMNQQPEPASAPDATEPESAPGPLRPTDPRRYWAARQGVQATAPASATAPLAPASPVAQGGWRDLGEVRYAAVCITVATIGFLTAGWFLSRALSMWLFMYAGMIVALEHMVIERGEVPVRDSVRWLLRWSFMVAFGLIALVYIILRIRNIVGH